MKIQLEFPFSVDYSAGYLVTNKEPRRLVCLIGNDKQRKSISYARYLMSVHLKRYLHESEEVDHIDNDKLNDTIENLQLLSKADNIKKSSTGRKIAVMRCPCCNNVFEKPYNQTHFQKAGLFNTCSYECKDKVLSKYGSNNKEKLKELGQNQLIEIKKGLVP